MAPKVLQVLLHIQCSGVLLSKSGRRIQQSVQHLLRIMGLHDTHVCVLEVFGGILQSAGIWAGIPPARNEAYEGRIRGRPHQHVRPFLV